jgi:hypothetical protein
MTLPTTRTKATSLSPTKLLIYSQPKTGKTSNIAALDDCLLIDLERGSSAFAAMKVEANNVTDIYNICEEIKKAGKPYKYIAIDTVTTLEDMCLPLALKLYQNTAMGKTYKESILNLPNGAGYKYLRDAFDQIVEMVWSVCDRLILLGHVKDKSIEKQGKEVISKDISLTGKIKFIACAYADAIGYLYREGNKNILSFETNEEAICGARSAHLRNKKIVLSEYDQATDTLKTNWDQIYID